MVTPIVDLRHVSRIFQTASGPLRAVDDVSLAVPAGTIHGVIGLSGAGKSTLLRTINLLERPDTGQVFVQGQDLTTLSSAAVRQARPGIGMIFQHFHLLNNLTVHDNVALPLEIAGVPSKERCAIVAERLATVGLSDKAAAYPSKLSGGQKQRVAIARALATRPAILLCDEPTSSVDPQTTGSILAYLKEVNQQFGITIVIVTHEMNVVNAICQRVTVMEEVVDKIQYWVEETELDGFNVGQHLSPSSFRDFIELVVPELQRRGMFRTSYAPGTFRSRLLGPGNDRLPSTHPGASYRRAVALA